MHEAQVALDEIAEGVAVAAQGGLLWMSESSDGMSRAPVPWVWEFRQMRRARRRVVSTSLDTHYREGRLYALFARSTARGRGGS